MILSIWEAQWEDSKLKANLVSWRIALATEQYPFLKKKRKGRISAISHGPTQATEAHHLPPSWGHTKFCSPMQTLFLSASICRVSHFWVLYACQPGSCQTVTALAMTSWVPQFQILAAHGNVNHSPVPESSLNSQVINHRRLHIYCMPSMAFGMRGGQSWTFLSWHPTQSSWNKS